LKSVPDRARWASLIRERLESEHPDGDHMGRRLHF